MNVLPAVCPGLFRLFALRAGSAMSAMAAALPPSPIWSFASIMPPSLPMSCSAACRRELLSRKNGSRLGNMRPNRSSRMTKLRGRTVCASAARDHNVPDRLEATAPLPSVPRKCRRLIVGDHSLRCLMDVNLSPTASPLKRAPLLQRRASFAQGLCQTFEYADSLGFNVVSCAPDVEVSTHCQQCCE